MTWPRYRNWVSKIGNCKLFWHPIFQGRPHCTHLTTIIIYLRWNINILCKGNYIGVRKNRYMLKIDISRSSYQKTFGCPKGEFWCFGCPNDAQTPCWLRLTMGRTTARPTAILLASFQFLVWSERSQEVIIRQSNRLWWSLLLRS